ncbi:hypothetical protein IIV30_141R [Invertebrate iridescent virus 30]|uniref:Uncharacterized protein n=1 Tax=Invertebrate iridescent virus 30 TaxID=345585 RepID=W8W274_9VIRU|nr:hypothetical protein IIV30_141R [Invertebrate iridescent virus 30]CCV02336.1 hypothetical protein IIV30_141R [Invertebrate iridescent virus 30]
MTSGVNFKLYDPVAQLIASGSGGGLPLSGGTLNGNLLLQAPSKVIQSQAPVTANDLTNKGYVDSLIGGGPFVPLAGGVMSGAISQPLAPIASNDLANKGYVDTFKYGTYLFKSTAPIFLNPAATVTAFSTGNTIIGPDVWSTSNITCVMNSSGVVTITNNLSDIVYVKLTFIACNLDDSMNSSGMVGCSFYNESTATSFGVAKTLKCLPLSVFNLVNETFVNQVELVALKSIAALSQFTFSVKLVNVGPNIVTIDGSPATNNSHLIIDRFV